MLSDLVRPAPVNPGSVVAVVSPSAPGVARWPHRVEKGFGYLRSLGLEPRLMPNAHLETGWVAGSAQARADDITRAFADPDIAVVLAAIGGNHSAQVLPFLDYDLIRANPKVFQGYSDITVLLWALAQRVNLQTFHGPSLIAELAENPQPLAYTDRWLRHAWFENAPVRFPPNDEWTDEFLDWNDKEDLTRPRQPREPSGWTSLRDGIAEGPLLGGCLETIMWHIHGTDIWIEPDGAMLFLETSEEAPSPAHVDAYLTTLERNGVFDRIHGLVLGRPYGYDEDNKALLYNVVRERTAGSGIPVLANVDVGHADPMLTLPLGATARIDTAALDFVLV